MNLKRLASLLRPGLVLAAAGLTACVAGPDFSPPALGAAPVETSRALAAQTDLDRLVASDWWRAFSDPVLDEIERRALAGNLDLAQAEARVQGGRAALRIAGADLAPRAGAAASYMRERASPKGILGLGGVEIPEATAAGGDDPFGASTLSGENGSAPFDLYQAGVDAAWEVDLWGANRRHREAARADAEIAALDRDALRVAMSAEVARVYAVLRGAEARLALLKASRATVADTLKIARRRGEEGASSRYDAASASVQLAAVETAIPLAEREAGAARNALALLIGEEPHALDVLLASGSGDLAVNVDLAGGLPSDLARARPDILSARAALHAATARVGARKADLYPSLTLAGSFGAQSKSLADLSGWSAHQFIAGPVIRLPIFEGGRLKGQLQLARAEEKTAAIRYRATVLKAWHEIDDALESVRAEQQRGAFALQAVEQSRIALEAAERRYKTGAAGYLEVLIAQRAALNSRAELAQARTAQAVAVTTLYRALGGGWTPKAQEGARS